MTNYYLYIILNTLTNERVYTTDKCRTIDLREEEIVEAVYEVTGGFISPQFR